ncbi:GIY-YIG nuclease family protein [Albimonas sp. CAU 1670]|uniref:GIY-YIG nuclease family protein n=1 Tax=Albimonas sp. CAU 1670 TaxID=3032599 RepID=UPI0023DA430D|nr:GIY-YIG nuclease family protein [Albimonas sp. CAU 1670]MDF2233098.1 GIY-YIG nuclease family protein [Albimonas sp. CAU 1670]
MKTSDRKAAMAAWKESKRRPGVWLVRCEATGEAWVGAGRDLVAARNRFDFSMRQGSPLHPDMKSALAAHGGQAFTFEEVESLEKIEEIALPRELKDRRAAAAERLGARAI